MLKQKQLFRNSQQEGTIGDCYRTCFACLLDLPVLEVPHFLLNHYDFETDSCDDEKINAEIDEWLKKKGFKLMYFYFKLNMDHVLLLMKTWSIDTYYIFCGMSSNGGYHATIGLADKIVWNPELPNKDGSVPTIVGPDNIDGFYELQFLVPYDMPFEKISNLCLTAGVSPLRCKN